MLRWYAQFRQEVSALSRNWLFVPLPLLYGAWMYFELTGVVSEVSQDSYYYAVRFHEVQHSLSLGVALLLGIVLLRRDLLRSSFEWVGALPISGASLIGAKFAAGFLYLSSFTLAMNAVYLWHASNVSVEWEVALRHAWGFAVQYELSYAVTLALGMAIGMWIPSRVTYLIGFCAWMFGTFFIDIFLIQGEGFYALKTFHLNQYFLDNVLENEGWGAVVLEEEVKKSRSFVASFTIFLLLFTAILLHWRRLSSRRKSAFGVLALSLFVCGLFFWPYSNFWNERSERMEMFRAYATPVDEYNSNPEQKRGQYTVSKYDIELKVNSDHKLDIRAVVEIDASVADSMSQVSFLLNPEFEIRAISADGLPLDYVRRGEQVMVGTQGLPTTEEPTYAFVFDYGGELLDWGTEYGSELYYAFVQDEEVLLPDTAAWFPLLADGTLYLTDVRGSLLRRRDFAPAAPYEIRVAVTGPDQPWYGTVPLREKDGKTYVYAGSDVTSTSFFGSKMFRELAVEGDSMRLVTTPSNMAEAKPYLADIVAAKQYYESWLGPLDRVHTVLYFPSFSVDYGLLRHQEIHGGTHIIAGSTHHNLDRFQKQNTLEAMLFGDLNGGSYFSENDPSDPAYSIVAEIRALYFMMLRWEDSDLNQRYAGGSRPQTEEGKRIYAMAEELVLDGKVDALKAILKDFYKKDLTIDWDRGTIPKYTMQDWNEVYERHVPIQ